MRRILTILTVSTLAFLMSGCGDEFLTREPKGQFSAATVSTADGLNGLLIGTYAMVDGTGLNGQAAWNNEISNWVFGGIPSDNALKGTDAGDQPEQSFIERYEFQTINGHIQNKWRGLYKGVARANETIVTANGEVDGLSDADREQIIAQARFLRGLFHFEAQKMWRFPLYVGDELFDINDIESTLQYSNSDMQQIWPQIEADFAAAAAVLPNTQSQVGRPTKFAAQAFLAKAILYQGWDDNGNANTAKLEQAKPLLESVIGSGGYSLQPKYSENFLVATRNNQESIWEVQFAVSSATGDASTQGVGLAHPYIAPWGCCGFYQASQNLVNAFRTNDDGLPFLDDFDNEDVSFDSSNPYTDGLDPRLDHTVGRPGVLYKTYQIHQTDFVRDLTYAGPYSSMKHVAEPNGIGVGGWAQLSANNYRIMRYGMVLLWLAEVEVELGNLDRARELVNMVRSRAANPDDFVPAAEQSEDSRQGFTLKPGEDAANYNISTYDAPWTNQDMARKAVRFESRLETAMEGHRFFDLQRWGIQEEVLNAYLDSESDERVYLNGVTFDAPKDQYYPIPVGAIDRSFLNGEATIVQDPNY